MPKFELYKHNDELFNIYYGIFYELWTFAYFDRLCKLEKRGDEIKKNLLLWNYWANLNQTLLKWSLGGSLSKLSVSAVLYPRWLPWLKIEISSNGQNCSILSQKVPKFELYKHNDGLFNIYYRIFYELWTFAYFERLCKLEKNLLLWNYWANLNQTLLKWSLGGSLSKLSVSAVLYPRWLPWLKIEISSNGQNCPILSQKVPKFELYKHNDELFNIYYGIFYELWTFAYFDRLCKLEKRRDEIIKKSSPLSSAPSCIQDGWNYWAKLNQTLMKWSLGGPLSKLCPSTPSSFQAAASKTRWPPWLKMEISSNGQICCILSQKVPKFELYKHNNELLTYITGFFMNFELLPILTDYAN